MRAIREWFKRCMAPSKKPHKVHFFVKDFYRDGYRCTFSPCSQDFVPSEEVIKRYGRLPNYFYGEDFS
jgi:hypothetical protein